MKQFLYIILLPVVISACGDNASTTGKELKTTVKQEKPADDLQSNNPGLNDVDVDTIGMAEFLAFKAAEVAKNIQSDDIQSKDITGINDINVDTIGFAEFKRLKAETARQAYEDSIRRAEIIAERKRYNTSGNSKTSTTKRATKVKESTDETESSDQTEVAETSPEPVKEKKGWSKKAKGAVIGAATGAAAGAVINKRNRKVGGVVGGVVGAATGYGIGRHKDKKDTVRKEELIQDTTEQQQ